MGMALVPFLAMWTLMMMAMMLPAVAPVASQYAQTIRRDNSRP
jgi:predicted metal-binding membrane protein